MSHKTTKSPPIETGGEAVVSISETTYGELSGNSGCLLFTVRRLCLPSPFDSNVRNASDEPKERDTKYRENHD